MAWHVAALIRTAEMPMLDTLTGEARHREAQSPEMMLHNLKLWKAALSAKAEAPDA